MKDLSIIFSVIGLILTITFCVIERTSFWKKHEQPRKKQMYKVLQKKKIEKDLKMNVGVRRVKLRNEPLKNSIENAHKAIEQQNNNYSIELLCKYNDKELLDLLFKEVMSIENKYNQYSSENSKAELRIRNELRTVKRILVILKNKNNFIINNISETKEMLKIMDIEKTSAAPKH